MTVNRLGRSGLLLFALLLVTFFSIGFLACGDDTGEADGTTEEGTDEAASHDAGENADPVAWGEKLVLSHGCHDCHSPKKMGPMGPEPDMARALSGHPADEVLPDHDPALMANWILANHNFTAYVGPWGTSYAANLTPDGTGLGGWTEEQFMKAMKEGWYKGTEGTRKLLPPMPWQGYALIPEAELKAIFAYLQTVPPVENAVPAAEMAGPPPGAGGAPGDGASSDAAAPEEDAAGDDADDETADV